MKLRIPLAVAVAAIALALISCGGGGGGGSKPLSATGRAVQNVQRLAILSMAKSGIALAPFMMASPGGTTGGTTGSGGGYGGGGVPSIGLFFRHFGDPTGFGAKSRKGGAIGRSTTASTTGGTNGGGGGEGEDFYFDEWLQLWVDVDWTETTYTVHFFIDQAGNMPAGHVASTYTGELGTYPQSYHNEYEFTAGPWTGAHGVYECVQDSATVGHMSYQDTFSDGSTSTGESLWNEEHATWESRWEKGEAWFEDSGEWLADGSGTYGNSNSEGWATTWQYNADWSGSAHFEGPDPLLPANMTWTSDGHYHITYADGTTEDWTWDEFWGGVGDSGTSGSTGGAGGLNTSGS